MEQKREKRPASFCGTYETTLEYGQFILPESFLSKLEAESPEKKLLCFFPQEVLQLYSEQGLCDLANEKRMCRHDQMTALRCMAGWSPEGAVQLPVWLMEKYAFSQHERVSLVGLKDRIELWKTDDRNRRDEALGKELEPYRDQIMRELLKLDE